ncbi:MAG: ornithine cyclodeaminase family protein [Pseudomonadota bacterium]
MRIINRQALASCLSHSDCVEALAPAMQMVSAGRVDMPLRQYMQIPETGGGKFTLMPGYLDDPRGFGVKIVCKYPREADSLYGSHVGAVMLFDAELGIPLALIDGSELTAIRTAAASALATRALAREDSRVLAILGTGLQALHHIHAIRAVRPIDEVRVWGRSMANADALAQSLTLPDGVSVATVGTVDEALDGADIVCTTTSAKTPILGGDQLTPGQHVNLVGAAIIEAAEADAEVVKRSRFVIDYWPSARDQAGELAAALADGLTEDEAVAGEIGQILAGHVAGRQDQEQITVYKSLGVSAQDLAAAHMAYQRASEQDLGVVVDWT